MRSDAAMQRQAHACYTYGALSRGYAQRNARLPQECLELRARVRIVQEELYRVLAALNFLQVPRRRLHPAPQQLLALRATAAN